jgi:hypothetical protein
LIAEQAAVKLMRRRVIRIQFNSAKVFAFSSGKVVIVLLQMETTR